MNILDNQKFRVYMFLDRCLMFPNYKILMLINDIETADKLLDEIMAYYKTKPKESYQSPYFFTNEICWEKVENKDDKEFNYPYTMIMFPNGSNIIIAPVESNLRDESAHAVMFDTQIRRDFLSEELNPKIIPYTMPQGSQMCNPKMLHLHTRPSI